jgi:hypothetical protein
MRVVQLETLTCASLEKKWTFLFQGALLGNGENKNVRVSISTETVAIHERIDSGLLLSSFFFLHHCVEKSKSENPHAPSSGGDRGESHFNCVPQFVFLDFLGLTHRRATRDECRTNGTQAFLCEGFLGRSFSGTPGAASAGG